MEREEEDQAEGPSDEVAGAPSVAEGAVGVAEGPSPERNAPGPSVTGLLKTAWFARFRAEFHAARHQRREAYGVDPLLVLGRLCGSWMQDPLSSPDRTSDPVQVAQAVLGCLATDDLEVATQVSLAVIPSWRAPTESLPPRVAAELESASPSVPPVRKRVRETESESPEVVRVEGALPYVAPDPLVMAPGLRGCPPVDDCGDFSCSVPEEIPPSRVLSNYEASLACKSGRPLAFPDDPEWDAIDDPRFPEALLRLLMHTARLGPRMLPALFQIAKQQDWEYSVRVGERRAWYQASKAAQDMYRQVLVGEGNTPSATRSADREFKRVYPIHLVPIMEEVRSQFVKRWNKRAASPDWPWWERRSKQPSARKAERLRAKHKTTR